MFSQFLVKIGDHLAKGLPLTAYRKSGEDRVTAILQDTDTLLYTEDFTETGFVFAPFDSERPTILIVPDEVHWANFDVQRDTGRTGLSVSGPTAGEKQHLDLIRQGIAEIGREVMEKVVLSRKVEVPSDKSPMALFADLLQLHPEAFCYLWYHPKVGTWLGASPEVLLHVRHKHLQTMSLAGTLPVVPRKDPVWGAKEREEQAMVTRYISHTLKDHLSALKLSETESVRAGSVWHLRTGISGSLGAGGLAAVLKALHPTPAVCGLPKKEAKAFILKHEPYDRTYYTGFLGELNFGGNRYRKARRRNVEERAYSMAKESTTLFVNLRCMQLLPNKAEIYVGGGITKDSVPVKEWQETLAKSTTMLRVLQNPNN